MVDSERVRDKLALLSAYRADLTSIDTTEEGAIARYSRRYLVQAGIQVCIDLAIHIIASEGWRTATDFRDAFARLAEHHIITTELAERLQLMVGLRNRLVHLYDDVDDSLIARVVVDDLDDWDKFAQSVARHASAGRES